MLGFRGEGGRWTLEVLDEGDEGGDCHEKTHQLVCVYLVICRKFPHNLWNMVVGRRSGFLLGGHASAMLVSGRVMKFWNNARIWCFGGCFFLSINFGKRTSETSDLTKASKVGVFFFRCRFSRFMAPPKTFGSLKNRHLYWGPKSQLQLGWIRPFAPLVIANIVYPALAGLLSLKLAGWKMIHFLLEFTPYFQGPTVWFQEGSNKTFQGLWLLALGSVDFW